MTDRTVKAYDGRALLLEEGGDPNGRPVLAHGGTPNSRLLYGRDVAIAERQGIRLISYDRPGYGGSDRQEGRSIADCTQDVRAIAEALGVERLGVIGGSGGGPHALACAALLGDLVAAVVVIASPAPWGADGLDYFAGMGELNVEDTNLYLADRVAARAKAERDREEMIAADAEQLLEILRTLLSPVDAAVLTGELAEFLVQATRSGMADGADGWWDDNVAMMEDWGFDLGSIAVPVQLRHGREDRFVPLGHGEWLAARIPGVTAVLSESEGHLSIWEHHLESMNSWLLAHIG
ncbi:MAG: alpha/beta fold hydrolase [Solirubrobacteraceae bacterium]